MKNLCIHKALSDCVPNKIFFFILFNITILVKIKLK